MVIASGMSKGAGISYDRLEDLVAELQRLLTDPDGGSGRRRWPGPPSHEEEECYQPGGDAQPFLLQP